MNIRHQSSLQLNRLLLCAGTVFVAFLSLANAQLVNPGLAGTTSYDGWTNLSRYAYTDFPGFPGTPDWPRAIDSAVPGSGDAEITRLATAADGTGGAYPAEETLYFFSFEQVPNALGGTLRVTDPTPLGGVKTVVLQIQIGEAEGYDFFSPGGVPVLKVNGGAVGVASLTPVTIDRYQNGTFESPETGLDEPVYVNTWGFQWDVSGLGPINSIQIDFSAVTHAQIYAMRLDQSSATYTSSVFDADTDTRVIGLSGNMAFGQVIAGSTVTRALTIANTGNAPLNVSGITFPAGLSGNWSSGAIAAGSSQNVTVTFSPTTATTLSGNIEVASDATGGTNTIPVSGSGVSATRIIGLSGDMSFGNVSVNTTSIRTLTIANAGNSALNITSINYPSGFSGNWSGGSIAAGASRNVAVTFSPVLAQPYSGTITVNSDRTSGANTISASGTGTAAATRIISMPVSRDFGSSPVGSTVMLTLTIHNTGNSPLNLTGISYPPGFSGETAGVSIASGGRRDITVSFVPDAAGDFSGSINVSSDSTAGSNVVAVAGKAVAPSIRAHLSGTPEYNGSITAVTHAFVSTPATWLNIEFTDNLAETNSWTPHSAPVYSASGEFSVTITKPGDHRASWERGLFFRLSYPTKP